MRTGYLRSTSRLKLWIHLPACQALITKPWRRMHMCPTMPSICATKTAVSRQSRFKTIWLGTIAITECGPKVPRQCPQPLSNRLTFRCNSNRCRSTWWINSNNRWVNGSTHSSSSKCRWTSLRNNSSSWLPQVRCSTRKPRLSSNLCNS